MANNPTSPTITNVLYLYHTDEWLLLPEYPDSIMDKMGSTFAQTNALSRTAPVFTYSYSGPREVQVQLHLHRDMVRDLNIDFAKWGLEDGEDFVESLIRKLQAIALPKYNASIKSITPPMIAIKFGTDIFIKGIVNSGVSIEYQKPILDDDRYSQVNLNFTIFETQPYDAVTVSKEGSFRGITKAFRDKFQ